MPAANGQALPPDDRAYKSLWKICRGLGRVLDELTFRPLGENRLGTMSVDGAVPQGWGGPDLHLTIWHGTRGGRGKDAAVRGLWIKEIQGYYPEELETTIVALDLSCPDAGLKYQADLKSEVRRAVRGMYELLLVAEDTHRGLTSRAERLLNFEQLNDAAYEGLQAGRVSGAHDGPVERLRVLCEESGLETVEIVPVVSGAIPDSLTVRTSLSLNGEPRVTMLWTEPGEAGIEVPWLAVGGWVQRLPRLGTDDPDVVWPEKHGPIISGACEALLKIHEAAAAIYRDATAGGPESVFELLSALSRTATQEKPADRPHIGRSWQEAVTEFIRLCRTGGAIGVSLEESLYGKLNIRSQSIDPVTGRRVEVQLYWEEPPGSSEPVHWIAADEATHPAHGGDPMFQELLSGFHRDSKSHHRHTIAQLHNLVDAAGEVMESKVAALVAMTHELGGHKNDDVEAIVAERMRVEAIEDSLAGLNGIARLYTGNPDQDIRNS